MIEGTILVVDDEPQVRRVMMNTLCRSGYEVITAQEGEGAIKECQKEQPDLVLLDINLPGMDGFQVCRHLREFCETPIIVLSARNKLADKIQVLNAGADDYVAKPFEMDELLARIRAALRRSSGHERTCPPVLLDDLKIDLESRRVFSRGRTVRLTPKEFDLLRLLLADPGQTISHRKLLQSVWGPDFGSETGYLRVFVNHLRKKIEPDPKRPKYLVTEPWVGYRFVVPQDTSSRSQSDLNRSKVDERDS